MKNNELSLYLNNAIDNIVSEVLKNTLQNPKETAFLLRYRKASKNAAKKRLKYEEEGQHIPAFLISSITNSCNLFCKGCYARANGICHEENTKKLLTDIEWEKIFKQGSELGIGFHLLAGGEPLLRKEVIFRAATYNDTIFPIFTNGTMIDTEYCELFDKNRNLIPVLSMEGTEEQTDLRRGSGTYQKLIERMSELQKYKILFGISFTVTKENVDIVTSKDFISLLKSYGCRVIFYIEYVPVDNMTKALAFTDKNREEFEVKQAKAKGDFPDILFLAFPGDEKYMGGCLAAGRGFFHISPYGDAEACPFSPYSDRSLKEHTILEVLSSPFFKKLQSEHFVGGEHTGGCALFEHEEKVKALL